MFDQILDLLEKELESFRESRKKIEGVMERVTDAATKAKLSIKYDEVCNKIDRITLCLSILKSEVSVEFSEDFMTVSFPRAVEGKKTQENKQEILL